MVSNDTQKFNRMVCADFITILADIVRDMIMELISSETTHFVNKEEKELYMPCFLKWIKSFCTTYMPVEVLQNA